MCSSLPSDLCNYKDYLRFNCEIPLFLTMAGNSAAVLEKKRDLQPWVSGRFHALSFSISLCLILTHVSYEASLLKHQVCFSLRDCTPSKGRSGWGRATPTAALKIHKLGPMMENKQLGGTMCPSNFLLRLNHVKPTARQRNSAANQWYWKDNFLVFV
jgi:hypothetical protein